MDLVLKKQKNKRGNSRNRTDGGRVTTRGNIRNHTWVFQQKRRILPVPEPEVVGFIQTLSQTCCSRVKEEELHHHHHHHSEFRSHALHKRILRWGERIPRAAYMDGIRAEPWYIVLSLCQLSPHTDCTDPFVFCAALSGTDYCSDWVLLLLPAETDEVISEGEIFWFISWRSCFVFPHVRLSG